MGCWWAILGYPSKNDDYWQSVLRWAFYTKKKNCAPQISKTQHPLVLSSTTTFHVSQAAPYFVLSTIFISPNKNRKFRPWNTSPSWPNQSLPWLQFLGKALLQTILQPHYSGFTLGCLDLGQCGQVTALKSVHHYDCCIYIYTFICCLFQVIIFVVLSYFTCVI